MSATCGPNWTADEVFDWHRRLWPACCALNEVQRIATYHNIPDWPHLDREVGTMAAAADPLRGYFRRSGSAFGDPFRRPDSRAVEVGLGFPASSHHASLTWWFLTWYAGLYIWHGERPENAPGRQAEADDWAAFHAGEMIRPEHDALHAAEVRWSSAGGRPSRKFLWRRVRQETAGGLWWEALGLSPVEGSALMMHGWKRKEESVVTMLLQAELKGEYEDAIRRAVPSDPAANAVHPDLLTLSVDLGLKLNQKTVVEAVAIWGRVPLDDLVRACGWGDPKAQFTDLQTAVNRKLKRHGWRLERKDNEVTAVHLPPAK